MGALMVRIIMMRKVLVISLVAVMTQSHVHEMTAERDTDAQDSTDSLIDKMLDRTQRASDAGQGLDLTTLGKASQFARVTRRTDSGLIYQTKKDSSSKARSRLPQRSLTRGAAQSDIKSGELGAKARGSPSFPSASLSKTSETLPGAKPIGRKTFAEAVSQPKPMSVKVDCLPEEQGGECDFTVQVKLTLEPAAAAAVQWRRTYSVESIPVIVVDKVSEESEAYRRGMRPGMVVKTLINSETDMYEMFTLKAALLSERTFVDEIRRARYPITFVMLEGVKMGSKSMFNPQELGKWIEFPALAGQIAGASAGLGLMLTAYLDRA
jgi:hypothetical protein